jgi:hypothetical protein
MIEKPQILTLNLDENANQKLKEHNFNIYQGSLGKLIETNNKKYKHKYCLLNNDFPSNIHEYDVVIIDLNNVEKEPYREEVNLRRENKTRNNSYLLSEYPQTIFDPRGFASDLLVNGIKEIMKHDSLIVVIQAENEVIDYKMVEENGDYPNVKGEKKFSIYEFMPNFPFIKNKEGKETEVLVKNEGLNTLLSKYNSDFFYELIFYHPQVWDGDNKVNDKNFYPLVSNRDGEIISFASFHEKTGLFLFPALNNKSDFLIDFLENVAPDILPEVFPFSTKNLWINDEEYHLPNHSKLLNDKKLLFEEWEFKNKQKEDEIVKNTEKYKFLHELLTETGNNLVIATIKFLEWLGFENVKDVDDDVIALKQEDIQIENKNGLLVIEVKGIGGTSKDSECSQVTKIKYRRAKERGSFDVFGLYIVNNQRHLPPIERKNPPFTLEQIADAKNEERGLLTTYQLFNLYFIIKEGILTKDEARDSLYKYGLIDFISANYTMIDTVNEIFLEGFVSIIKLNNIEIKQGLEILIEKDGKYRKTTIKEIKVDDKSTSFISNGEVGIKTDIKISKKSKVWKKNLP